MTPRFLRIQDSGERRTSGEAAQFGVNPGCAAAGEAGTFEGDHRFGRLLGRWAHSKGANVGFVRALWIFRWTFRLWGLGFAAHGAGEGVQPPPGHIRKPAPPNPK